MGFSKKRLKWYFREVFGMAESYIYYDRKLQKEVWRLLRMTLDVGVHLGILKDYPWEGFPDDNVRYGYCDIRGPWKIKELLDELSGYRYEIMYGGHCEHPDEYYNRWVYPVHKSLIHTEIYANLTSSAKKSLGVNVEDLKLQAGRD